MTIMSARWSPRNVNIKTAIAVPVVHNLNARVVTRLMVESVASAPSYAKCANGQND